MKKILLLMATVLMAGLFTACGGKKINLNDYVIFECSGYDTIGTAYVSFDREAFMEDYEEVIKVKKANEMIKMELAFEVEPVEIFLDCCVSYKTEIGDKLSNGDKVEFKWNCDDEVAEECFGCTLVYSDITLPVNGLEALEYFDAFEGVEVDWDGYSPNAVLTTVEGGKAELPQLKYRVMEQAASYANGDVITIEVYCMEGWDYFANMYGKLPSEETMLYTVEGLPYYAEGIGDIPNFDTAIEETRNWILENETSVYIDYSEYYDFTINSCEYIGSYVAAYDGVGKKYTVQEGWDYKNVENCIFMLYKMNVSLPLTDANTKEETILDVEYILPIYYYNFIVDENGNCELLISEADIQGDQNYVVDTNVCSNPYWDHICYKPKFNGYGSVQEFSSSVLEGMRDSYKIEENMQ